MEQSTLDIEIREQKGKGVARRLRSKGLIPGILYGRGDSIPITANPLVVTKWLLSEGGKNQLFTLSGTGVKGKAALIKDYQVDPVSRKLLHVDLLEIDITKSVEVNVILAFTGKAAGVAEGGVLNIVERKVMVRCLPTKIPKQIEVDVSGLNIGDSIHLDELNLPEGLEKVSHGNSTLVTCVPPTKEEEVTAVLAPTAEPEVITEKKPKEGDEAAAAEGADKEKK